MNRALHALRHFFFEEIEATGFGLLRMLWGALVFLWMLAMLGDVAFFYSDSGFLPHNLSAAFRSEYRFTLLDTVTSPAGVHLLYALLLLSAFLACIGKWARFSTVLTLVLLLSFHERNLLPLGGGDKVLATVGFLLAICPELRAFSVDRIPAQWAAFRSGRKLLPPLIMPVWPYRLLLWQVLIIYLVSGWEKATGTMWWQGTAVAAVYHHTHFARWPQAVMDFASTPFISATVSYYTLLFEFAWLALLVPRGLAAKLPQLVRPGTVKRALLLGGVAFHGGIFLMTEVGPFPMAMLATYAGLLFREDFDALRGWKNRRFTGKIHVLFDGQCGFCRRSVFVLALLDCLRRLKLVNFHDVNARKAVDPDLTFEALDKAMHIYLPSGRVERGFDAFRELAWHLPAFWPLAPFLYLPGVPPIGRRVYAYIAERRKDCTGDACLYRRP